MSVLKYKDSDGVWNELETNVVVQGEKYFVKVSFDMTKFNLDAGAFGDEIPVTDADKTNLINNPYNCVFILTDTTVNDYDGHSQYVFYPTVNQQSADSDNNISDAIMFVCAKAIDSDDPIALGTPTYYGIYCEGGECFVTNGGKLSLESTINKKVESSKPQYVTLSVSDTAGTLTATEVNILKASERNFITWGGSTPFCFYLNQQSSNKDSKWWAYYYETTGQYIYVYCDTDLTWKWKLIYLDFAGLYRHRIVSSFGSPYEFELIWFDKKNIALTKDEILTVVINGEHGATFYANGTGGAGSYCRMLYFKDSGKVQGQFINVSDGTLTKTFIDLAVADVTFTDYVYQLSTNGGAGNL